MALDQATTAERLSPTVLVVDDVIANIDLARANLGSRFRVLAATSGTAALELLSRGAPPDLILLDVMMPNLNGYQTLHQIRQTPGCVDIPVIFVTAMNEVTDEVQGLSLGAVDYISKPYQPAILLARVSNAIELAQARHFLKNKNVWLEQEIARHLHDRELVQDISLRALASLAETRDNETGNHILRTQYYVKELALALRKNRDFSPYLSDEYIDCAYKAAPLHDIGKVGIPDAILLKPGKLTPEEFEIMKTHVNTGAEAVERALISVLIQKQICADDVAAQQIINTGTVRLAEKLPNNPTLFTPLKFLLLAREIARWHHERWDGSGYPDGLAGDAIPLSAQLMAVADVFDALISKRCYKPSFPLNEVVRLMDELSGRQFDPRLIAAFHECVEVFASISSRYRDHDE